MVIEGRWDALVLVTFSCLNDVVEVPVKRIEYTVKAFYHTPLETSISFASWLGNYKSVAILENDSSFSSKAYLGSRYNGI